jgi:hypothetical protein
MNRRSLAFSAGVGVLAGALACSSESDSGAAPAETLGNAGTGGTSSGGRVPTGGRPTATGGREETGGARDFGTGGHRTEGGDVSSAGAAAPPEPGSCGLAEPAFCDGFDAEPRDGGRSGELDPAVWSGHAVAAPESQRPVPDRPGADPRMP